MPRPLPLLTLALLVSSLTCGLAPQPGRAQDFNLGIGDEGFNLGQLKAKATAAELSATLTPADAQPGDEVTLAITAKLPKGSYTYSTTVSEDLAGLPTRIELKQTTGLEPIDNEFTPDHAPKRLYNEAFEKDVEKFTSEVTWSRKFRLAADAKPKGVQVTGTVDWQVCTEVNCTRMTTPFTTTLSATKSDSDDITQVPLPFETRPQFGKKAGPAVVQAGLVGKEAKVGDTVTLAVRLKLDEGWHAYGIEMPDKDANIQPTKIKVTNLKGLKALGEEFQPDRDPVMHHDDELDQTTAQFETQVTWTREYEVTDADYSASGEILYMVCTHNSCTTPLTIAFELRKNQNMAAAPAANRSEPESALGAVAADLIDRQQGIAMFLVTAALAGFASLLTPCVFPMVPITVSVFLKQSEREHHRPIVMASVYAGGIIVAFTALGVIVSALFSATALNEAANYVSFNLIMAGVLIFFGLNLLGMFELRVPSWLLTWSSEHENKGGVIGVLFMALTFTLVSFTCTFAFVGMLLALAAQGEVLWPVLGMLAFSTAFALPFFFLALFPSFLHKLPKSGGWMNTIKVTMGLIELGAALKFLSVADAAANPLPVLFDYTFVITAWMILAVATGLYLLGLFRLPHDTPTQTISVPRFLFATSFLGLAAYMAVGLFANVAPTGIVWEQIHAMAPPNSTVVEGTLGPSVEEHGLEFGLDYERALAYAKQENRPVFIDFTGVNCPNCRLMEKRMAEPSVHERLERFVRVKVYTDSVPGFSGSKERELLEKNRRFQQTWYEDTSLPAYALVAPNQQLLARTAGAEPTAEFAGFLATGLEKWQALPTVNRTTSPLATPAIAINY